MIRGAPHRIRLSSHWRLLASWFGFKVLMALAVALPFTETVWGTGITQWPGGDQVLFEPGGGLLFELAYRQRLLWQGALRSALLLALVAGAAGIGPLIAAMVVLAHGGRLRFSSVAGRSATHLRPFALLALVTLCSQGAIALVTLNAIRALRSPLQFSFGERNGDLLLGAMVMLGGLVLIALGVLQDLARAVVVHSRSGAGTALWSALGLLRERPGWLLVTYLARASWSVALLIGAAAIVIWVSVDQPGEWRIALVWLVHQAASFGLLWIRADWLTRLIELVASPLSTV